MTDTQREAFEAAYAKQWSTVVGNEKTGADVAKLRTDDVGEPYGDRAYLNGCWWGYQAAQAADAGREAVAWILMAKNGMVRSVYTRPLTGQDYEFAEIDGDTIIKLYAHPPIAAINAELVEALEAIVERFGPCEKDYIFSKRMALQKARAALSRAKEQKS